MSKPTIKKSVIIACAEVKEGVESLKENRLILLTPMGLVSGNVTEIRDNYSDDASYDVSTDLLPQIAGNAVKTYREEFNDNQPLDGSDGFIILKDVVITTSSGKLSLYQAVIFFDQILGVTIGED